MFGTQFFGNKNGGPQMVGFCLVVEFHQGGSANTGLLRLVNRPGVAGAVLQTPL